MKRLVHERYLTLGQVAELLNLPPWKMQRAASAGVFPTYQVANGRRLAKLSEVVAAIEATRTGGIDG